LIGRLIYERERPRPLFVVSRWTAIQDETAEWQESLTDVVSAQGHERGGDLMLALLKRSKELHLGVPMVPTTDYLNTIAPENEVVFPGDEDIERQYRAWIRWNSAIMVHRAQRPGIGVGGHIGSYASSASLYEVGHNHFFRGPDHPGGGDQIFYQGHAAPGMYARAFLEGRLTEDQLDGFRQEKSHFAGGLSSYPHPVDAQFLAVPDGVNGSWSYQCDLSGAVQQVHDQPWNQGLLRSARVGLPR